MKYKIFSYRNGKNRELVTVNNSYWNYSDFQVKLYEEISKKPGFEHFCSHRHAIYDSTPRRSGPFMMIYYINGKIQSHWVGQNKILS